MNDDVFIAKWILKRRKHILRRLIGARSMFRPRNLSLNSLFACFVNKEFVIFVTFSDALAKHIENKHTINICFNLNIIFAAFSLFPTERPMNVWPLLCTLHGTPLFMYFQPTTGWELEDTRISSCDIFESFFGLIDVTCLSESISRPESLTKSRKACTRSRTSLSSFFAIENKNWKSNKADCV